VERRADGRVVALLLERDRVPAPPRAAPQELVDLGSLVLVGEDPSAMVPRDLAELRRAGRPGVERAKHHQVRTSSHVDHSALVALGGGMVGDLTGFAAATYLRGIPFVQIPTTVLAMVDASIGGKTAVNLKQGKNLVGSFHQPSLVWIDTATLASLPRRQSAAGLAEVVKAGAIWDARFFARLERDCERIHALEDAALIPVLERACRIKAEVVGRDERERTGLRALLNFGHTVAHAIEAEQGYQKIMHGEAVSIGMVHSARRSEELGLAPAGTSARLEALLLRLGLPVEIPPGDRNAHLAAIRVDKKKVGGKIDYVALRGIGRAETVKLTAAQILPNARPTRRRGSRA
jgi:3-dehydroquinate synthase